MSINEISSKSQATDNISSVQNSLKTNSYKSSNDYDSIQFDLNMYDTKSKSKTDEVEDSESDDDELKATSDNNIENQMNALLLQNMQNLKLNQNTSISKLSSRNSTSAIDKLGKSKELLFDVSKLTKDDASFLKKVASGEQFSIPVNNTQQPVILQNVVNQNNEVSYKSFDVSKGLSEIVDKAFKMQKPVRLDFDGNSSVILKIDKQGKVSAEFLSSDAAMESVLKANIPNLKTKFDTEGIPYKQIMYKEQNRKNNKNGGR